MQTIWFLNLSAAASFSAPLFVWVSVELLAHRSHNVSYWLYEIQFLSFLAFFLSPSISTGFRVLLALVYAILVTLASYCSTWYGLWFRASAGLLIHVMGLCMGVSKATGPSLSYYIWLILLFWSSDRPHTVFWVGGTAELFCGGLPPPCLLPVHYCGYIKDLFQ